MAVAEQTGHRRPSPRRLARRKRSFRPRYPAWLTAPSLLYYAVFFLGPMAHPGGVLARDPARIRQPVTTGSTPPSTG